MHDPDSFEIKQLEFPKEFERKLSHLLDGRYYTILLGSVIFHILIVVYFLLHPLPQEKAMDRIARIQERLARAIKQNEANLDERLAKLEFVRGEPITQPDPEPDKIEKPASAPPKRTGETSAPKKTSEAPKVADRDSRRGRGGRRGRPSKAEIEATVGSKGILGLLTSTGSTARGDEVQDILGRSGKTTDLDQALSELTGIKTTGKPGGNGTGDGSGGSVKGGRSEGADGIDGLVSGLGKTKSSSFSRTGDLVVVSESPLIERTGAKGIVGRDQDDVQAVVMRHNNSIQYCYERELKRNPTLKGKVVLRFTITPAGTVKNVEILSSTLNNRKVEQCIVSRVRRWTDFGAINPSYGDTTIRQVYAFGY